MRLGIASTSNGGDQEVVGSNCHKNRKDKGNGIKGGSNSGCWDVLPIRRDKRDRVRSGIRGCLVLASIELNRIDIKADYL